MPASRGMAQDEVYLGPAGRAGRYDPLADPAVFRRAGATAPAGATTTSLRRPTSSRSSAAASRLDDPEFRTT